MTKTVIQRKLEIYNLEFNFTQIPFRNDPGEKNFNDKDARHYAVTIKRTLKNSEYKYIKIYYSMGSLNTDIPNLVDVLGCLLLDTSNLDSFEDWCYCFGYDTDSIKANNIYKECLEEKEKLEGMFTKDEIKKLNVIFEDY